MNIAILRKGFSKAPQQCWM